MAEAEPGGHQGHLKLEASLGAEPAGPPSLGDIGAFVLSQRQANSHISETKEKVLKDLLAAGQRTGVTTLIANSSGKTFFFSIDCFDQSHFFPTLRILNKNGCHMHSPPQQGLNLFFIIFLCPFFKLLFYFFNLILFLNFTILY